MNLTSEGDTAGFIGPREFCFGCRAKTRGLGALTRELAGGMLKSEPALGRRSDLNKHPPAEAWRVSYALGEVKLATERCSGVSADANLRASIQMSAAVEQPGC